MPTFACESCDALNKEGASRCAECGAPLRDEPAAEPSAAPDAPWPAKPRARRGGPADDEDARTRSRRRQEFARVKRTVLTVRSIYWAGVVFAVAHLLLVFAVLGGTAAFEPELAWLLKGIAIGQLALMIAGGLLVLRSPLIWTAVGASYWTLNTVAQLVVGGWPPSPVAVVMILIMVSFWFGVGQAARVERLMAEDEDLQIVRKKIDPSRRVEGGVADSARERRQRERAQSRAGRWRLLALVAGGLVLLAGGVWAATRPPSVDGAIDELVTRWRSGDVATIGPLWADGASGRSHSAFVEGLERRGWSDALPALGAPQLQAGDAFAIVRFACDGGEVGARLRLHDARGWQLVDLDLPDLVPGDLEPALAAFRAAWRAEGSEDLVALFRPDARARVGRSLRRSLEKRGWLERRPAFDGVHVLDDAGARRRAQFDLDLDQVGVTFEWWHPRWYLVGFRPPE